MSYEEKELNQRFKETWIEQKKIERSFKEKENEFAGDERKIMFGLIRKPEQANEMKQTGEIKQATLFTSKETQANIDRLEKDSKEMARNFHPHPDHDGYIPID